MLGALSYVVKFYCCCNVAESDMDFLSCGRLWSESSFRECVESFLLCIVGKMAQDVG